MIKTHIEEINTASQELIRMSKANEIRLDDPVYEGLEGIPTKTKYRDVIANMIILSFVMNSLDIDELEKALNDIGFGEKERDELEFVRAVNGQYSRAKFLRIVDDALYYPVISELCNSRLANLASGILKDYMQEGIDKALDQLERSKNVLRSKFLGIGIFLLSITTLGAVMILFGTTKETVGTFEHTCLILVISVCFFVSLLITLVLIEKIFTRV